MEGHREDLQANKGLWKEPWCVGGAFNVVRFVAGHSRGSRMTAPMRRFFGIINELELRDLPMVGGPFTCSGG